MSQIYDNWERLVAAVLKREELRRIALDSSREPSLSSSLSSTSVLKREELRGSALDGSREPSFSSSLSSSSVLKREELRRSALDGSREPSFSSSLFEAGSSTVVNDDLNFHRSPQLDGDKHGVASEPVPTPAYYGSTKDQFESYVTEAIRDTVADGYKKKMIMKVDINSDKERQKAMKAVTRNYGVDLVAMNMKEKKLTLVGDFDPVSVVKNLRRLFHCEIVMIGPAEVRETKEKEIEVETGRKDQSQYKERQKDEITKEDRRRRDQLGQDDERKKDQNQYRERQKDKISEENRRIDPSSTEQVAELVKLYQSYNPYMQQNPYYRPYSAEQYRYSHPYSMEENPNACVIS